MAQIRANIVSAERISAKIGSQGKVIIEHSRGWGNIPIGEIWSYRDLSYFMVWRGIQSRYRQTALGPIWIVLQPLFSMVLYTIIFGVIANLPSGDVPYQVFTYCALLPWGVFSDSVTAGSTSLLSNKNLIAKIYFPRLILPLTSIMSNLVDFGISFLILIGMLIYYRITPTIGIIFLPLFLLLGILFGVGLGFWFSGLLVKFRDFGQILGYFVRLMMFASPVVYSPEIVPPQFYTIFNLNPVTNMLAGFRWALLGNPPPDWTLFTVSYIFTLVVFVGGTYVFNRVEKNIVDLG